MPCSQLKVLLVALSVSVLPARVSGAPYRDVLTDMLRADSTKCNEDLSRILLLKMMSDQMTTTTRRNKVLPDLEEELGIREEVVRQLPLTHRERKAGCRNFFWKTFTSC
ncbi:somatostatin-1 [Esox lucius]|uniref:somatostatin-1 n=1 Tax=Esox lucius TaxID=8010 RepID=UPI0014777810|nr:somatostatin-1 [Esox lucius]